MPLKNGKPIPKCADGTSPSLFPITLFALYVLYLVFDYFIPFAIWLALPAVFILQPVNLKASRFLSRTQCRSLPTQAD